MVFYLIYLKKTGEETREVKKYCPIFYGKLAVITSKALVNPK